MLDEVSQLKRKVMLGELSEQAHEWLGDNANRFFALGRWTDLLNKIDPASPHHTEDEAEAIIWRDKAILYLTGYLHGLKK